MRFCIKISIMFVYRMGGNICFDDLSLFFLPLLCYMYSNSWLSAPTSFRLSAQIFYFVPKLAHSSRWRCGRGGSCITSASTAMSQASELRCHPRKIVWFSQVKQTREDKRCIHHFSLSGRRDVGACVCRSRANGMNLCFKVSFLMP